MNLTLQIVNDGREKIVSIESTHFTLGREGAVRIEDGSCSREHAEICVDENGRLVLFDLASRNGTFVNGKLVQVAILNGDEVVQLGNTLVKLISKTAGPTVVHAWPELFNCLPKEQRHRLSALIQAR